MRATSSEELQFGKAINAALADSLTEDENVLLMGEDIGALGGVFRVTEGLQEKFGKHRVLDSPLAESGIVGTAIGMTYAGLRPVVEIQFDGFIYPAFDQIVTQLAKLRYRSGGTHSLPITIRVPFGGHIGSVEHHSESPESYFAHTAGLKVVTAATSQQAYSTLRSAIESDDPVLFFEPKAKYWARGSVDRSVQLDLESAALLKEGTDLTLVAYGPSVDLALDVATVAAGEGIDIEVIDLRVISPIDAEALIASVQKTGRLVVVSEAPGEASVAAEVVTLTVEEAFGSLLAAPERVTAYDLPYVPSKWEEHYLPSLDRVLDAVDRSLGRRNSRD